MSEILRSDAAALHLALESPSDSVSVHLSRQTASWIADLLEARSRGDRIVITHGQGDVTPAEAAELLGVTRAQVQDLMDSGQLDTRASGADRRIPVTAIESFRARELQGRTRGMRILSQLQNDLGLLD